MIELNQIVLNQEYDDQIAREYEEIIKDGSLEIGDWFTGYQEVPTNLKFIEKLNIQTLRLYINTNMSVKLQSRTIKELTLRLSENTEEQVLNLKVDDLELESLEVMNIDRNNLQNDQLYNLSKFKKLHSLNVSQN
ncbi:Hypothetical_protein [Hexamita inflata]|uniref:Hypothetical_protein n=1 Tax=Hexamita inflata TaxID=28002 RepID=A0AA86PJ00_9EUKA|nr:Hypothetical protein HINF_LOCUS26998 [Hexamita inflata]